MREAFFERGFVFVGVPGCGKGAEKRPGMGGGEPGSYYIYSTWGRSGELRERGEGTDKGRKKNEITAPHRLSFGRAKHTALEGWNAANQGKLLRIWSWSQSNCWTIGSTRRKRKWEGEKVTASNSGCMWVGEPALTIKIAKQGKRQGKNLPLLLKNMAV